MGCIRLEKSNAAAATRIAEMGAISQAPYYLLECLTIKSISSSTFDRFFRIFKTTNIYKVVVENRVRYA